MLEVEDSDKAKNYPYSPADLDTGKNNTGNLDFDKILDQMKQLASVEDDTGNDTGKIAEGTIYHFFEGRKKDRNGHWQGNEYFYWQLVYRDPDTGKRIRKGGKSFHTCPDEARKQQFLRDTGRTIEPNTGRLQKVSSDTGTLPASVSIGDFEISG